MTTTITKRKNGQIEESLEKVIVPRIKRNLAEMEQLALKVTTHLRIAIGRDLIKAKAQVPDGEWRNWLRMNFALSYETARHYIINASESRQRSVDRHASITDTLRRRNPSYALPRQKVDEQPVRNILDGIDEKVFADRAKSDAKESRIKKAMALELVDAGFRVLSHKLHADKGGSDDAMRRLDEVRKAIKRAIAQNEINL